MIRLCFPERALRDDERPLEVLQEWGSSRDQVKFVLRYQVLDKVLDKALDKPQNGELRFQLAARDSLDPEGSI